MQVDRNFTLDIKYLGHWDTWNMLTCVKNTTKNTNKS